MPALTGDDDKMLAVVRLGLGECEIGDRLLYLLALAIASVKHRSKLTSCRNILLLQKFYDVPCYIHPSGRVDTRPDPKTDMITRHLRVAIGNVHQGPQAAVIGTCKINESKRDDRTVLTGQIHYISYGPDGGDLKKPWHLMLESPLTKQCMCKFECHADTGKMFVRIGASSLIWLDDGNGWRITAHRIGEMMVRDDHIEPVIACPFKRFETPDTAIDAYDQ